MANTSADATRISTEAAQRFVESYYPALQSSRATLTTFYLPSSSSPSTTANATSIKGNTTSSTGGGPTIVINGNVIPDAHSLQTIFEQQMPQARYEVQSYDCHVLNPEYVIGGGTTSTSTTGTATGGSSGSTKDNKNMSIILTVSGYVRYGEATNAAMRGFSENFVLVPHPWNTGALGPGRGAAAEKTGALKREWVIQTQNFRLVV
ncbi:MAG: hypothetical protein M1823_006122 [Watsoniomyces obsoletus]|nr:MAG: hypothetical protein M1823_006122 [Watsoniomyces obsoletus]